MALRLMRPRPGLIAFVVIVSFYFCMKYYLVSVPDVSSYNEQENLHSSLASRPTVSVPMPPYEMPVATGNKSFVALVGDKSCRADVLGAPAFVRAAGCNNGECNTITCQRLLAGNSEAVAAAVKFAEKHKKVPLHESELLKNALNCKEFLKRGGYRNAPVRSSDKQFPIAFNILLHWQLEQFEKLLRAIYRPRNLYCIHVDAKTSWTFHSAVSAIANCLPNVYIATRRQHVVYAAFSRLQADIDCMQDHVTHHVRWHYLINVAGQSYPLRTPEEMVDILRVYNGANDIEGIYSRRIFRRFKKVLVNFLARVGFQPDLEKAEFHPEPEVWRERLDLGKVQDMNTTHPAPPHDIDIVRGSAYGVFSRKFVEYILTDQRAKDLLEWSRDTYSPDEHYWATLHHTYSNPHMHPPGGYSGVPESKPFLAVYVKWYPEVECHGFWKRGICILGAGDLASLVIRPEFFVNKFFIEYQPMALECMEAWLEHRVLCTVPFNSSYYQRLPFVIR